MEFSVKILFLKSKKEVDNQLAHYISDKPVIKQ